MLSLRKLINAPAIALVLSMPFFANQDASALTKIEFSGSTQVDIENSEGSGNLGTAFLSIFGDLSYDEMAAESSLNNFSGAAYNLSLILDFDGWSPDSQIDPPDFFLPYFSDFQSNPEYSNGDVFVGNNGGGSEFGISFPVFAGPALLNEPFDLILVADTEIFSAGDLQGATEVLLNAADPLSLFDLAVSNVYYQGPLGEGLEDNLFFEFNELTVTTVAPVPLPAPLLMILMPLVGLLFNGRR